MYDFSIKVIELPLSVRGVTALEQSGKYNIFINSRYSIKERNKILREELDKIEGLDRMILTSSKLKKEKQKLGFKHFYD